MTSGLPCPNPACKHLFAFTEVKGATALTCPRCGGVFQFRAGGNVSPHAVTPAAVRVAQAPPMARSAIPVDVKLVDPLPVASSSPPSAMPFAGTSAGPPITSIVPSAVVQRHRQQASGSWLGIVMACMVVMIVVGMILGGYFMFRATREEKPTPTGPRFAPGPRQPIQDDKPPRVTALQRDPVRAPKPEPEQDNNPAPARPTVTLHGDRSELDVPVGFWTKYKADEEDEQGDLFLRGSDPKEKDEVLKTIKSATVLVVVLDKTEANLQAAGDIVRDRLEKQLKMEDKAYKVVPASERPPAESEMVGDRPGRILEFKIQKGEEPRKYVLLGIVNDPEALYAIRCTCNWEYRQVWQSEFRDLLKSFRVRKKDKAGE